MVSYEFVQNFFQSNFPEVKEKNQSFNIRCRLCGDSKRNLRKMRFFLKYTEDAGGVWKCHNCNKSGNFLGFYSIIKGISINEAIKEININSFGDLKKTLRPKRLKKIKRTKATDKVHFNYFTKDWIGINEKKEGMIANLYKDTLRKYLAKRKLPTSYPFYIAYQGDFKDRIIIPIFDKDNDIIYFQGRIMEDKFSELRYKNPDVSDKKHIILNEHKFNPEKYIVVTEGPIDAIMVGDQGTTCFGSSVDDEFLEKLSRKTNKGIILALDNDNTGKEETLKIIQKSKFGKLLFYFVMPFKDIKDLNELSIKKDVNDIYSYIVSNAYTSFEYLLRSKLQK